MHPEAFRGDLYWHQHGRPPGMVPHGCYRSTSLTRGRILLAPYSRHIYDTTTVVLGRGCGSNN